MLPSKQMIQAINQALSAEYGHRNDPDFYQTKKIRLINKDVVEVTFERIRDYTICVAISVAAAKEYADKRIRYRLKNQTSTFDGEYLLRHIKGGLDAHIEDCPTEARKHARVADLGLDVESATKDYRAGYGRYELDWIAGAVDSSRVPAKRVGEVVYWYK